MINKFKEHKWLWIALIVVLLLIVKFSLNSFHKYQVWSDHKTYFEQSAEQRKIQTWMTPNFIKRHYGFGINSTLGFTPGFWEDRKSLDELCLNHQLDCSMLVDKLHNSASKQPKPTKH